MKKEYLMPKMACKAIDAEPILADSPGGDILPPGGTGDETVGGDDALAKPKTVWDED